jgi:hypothetical protein
MHCAFHVELRYVNGPPWGARTSVYFMPKRKSKHVNVLH